PLTLLSLFSTMHTATTELYTLSLHDALPIFAGLKDTPFGNDRSHVFGGCDIEGGIQYFDTYRGNWSATEDRGDLLGLAMLDRNRSEEHTSELQSRFDLVCRLLLEKKKMMPIF